MKSMTGYGKAEYKSDDLFISVQMRTVNHRFLDITTQMPSYLLPQEDLVKKIVKQYLLRGRVELSIHIDSKVLEQKKLQTNWSIVEQYVTNLQNIKNKYNLPGKITIDMIAQYPNIMETIEEASETSGIEHILMEKVTEAIKQVVKMREQEGIYLKTDLEDNLQKIENILKWLGERRNIVIIEYQDRIKARIGEYLQDASIFDQAKLHQDIAILAEKGDITEELTRLHSHIAQFRSIILETEAIGRKLDFVVQEMHRECNTIGSKSNDAEISAQVIPLKGYVEKLKEQVQNIE
ncbi:YicC/YloC family endoribonuclease [Gracilibacillus xinjiangensis]|uniref:YicC/YloC family endoribonuclease n=1 Tax=Gracilibacillus xinjiangensis TaxID=1193282 RepID=A0ABV8X2W8_9BACI